MDIDEVPVDSEDKENVFRHKWPSGLPCTPPDKACDDLDASEMNMRLRLSCTPLASPTPNKRFTGSAKKLFPESGDNESINTTLTNNSGDVTMMELSMGDNNRSNRLPEEASFHTNSCNDELNGTAILQSGSSCTFTLDPVQNVTITLDDKNKCIDVLNGTESPDQLCNKEPPKLSTSPIMRGLKSVFSMFRTSQSSITPEQDCQNTDKVTIDASLTDGIDSSPTKIVLASTPLQSGITKEQSPLKITSSRSGDSIVFNEDLINDLQWNDDSTIIFNKFPTQNISSPSLPIIQIISTDVNTSPEFTNLDPKSIETDDLVYQKTGNNNATNCIDNQNIKIKSENTNSVKHITEDSLEYVKEIVDNLLDSVFEEAEKNVEKQIESQLSNMTENTIIKPENRDTFTLDNSSDRNVSLLYAEQDNTDKLNLNKTTSSEKSLVIQDTPLLLENIKDLSKVENYVHVKNNANNVCDVDVVNIPSNSHESETLYCDDTVKLLDDHTLNNGTPSNELLYESLQDSKDNEHITSVCGMQSSLNVELIDYNSVDPFVTRSKLSLSPPKTDPDNKSLEIENTFVSRPRITMSPVHNTNKNFTSNEIREKELNNEIKPPSNKFINIHDSKNNIHIAPDNISSDKVCGMQSSTDAEVNYNDVDPFAINSKLSMSPPKTLDHKHYLEIENPFVSRPRVSMSPVHITNENVVINDETSENILNNDVEPPSNQSVDNSEECDEIIDIAEMENMNLSLDCIATEHFSDNDIHNVEAREQSDAYLSADSGRESEQLLEFEVDIDEHVKIDSNQKNLSQSSPTYGLNQTDDSQLNFDTTLSAKTNSNDTPPLVNKSLTCEIHTDLDVTKDCIDLNISSKLAPELICKDVHKTLATSSPNLVQQKQENQIDPDSIMTNTFNEQDISNISSHESNKFCEKMYMLSVQDHLLTKSKNQETSRNEDNKSENFNPFQTISKIGISPPTTPTKELGLLSSNDVATLDECMKKLNLTNQTCTEKLHYTANTNTAENTFIVDGNTVEKTFIVDDNTGENTFVVDNNDVEKTFVMDNNDKCNLEVTITSDSNANKTFSSNNSSLSDKDTTVKEIKTEDEDTIEGPDIEKFANEVLSSYCAQSNISDCLEKPEKELERPDIDKNQMPEVILCSDLKSAMTGLEDFTSEEEFMECNDEEFKPGELFINANTFDFLMNKGSGYGGIDSGKESLFLKFDPLCSQDKLLAGSLPVSNEPIIENDNLNTTETVPDKLPINISVTSIGSNHKLSSERIKVRDPGPSTANIHITPEKPMMAVLPAVNNEPSSTARNTAHTPIRPDRPSSTFSSPAIAAIDRLISLSGSNSPANQTYYMENASGSRETREAIIHVQDVLAQKEIEVAQLKQETKELHDRLTDLEIQMKSLVEDNEERLKKINDLKSKLAHKTALNKNMSAVVEEYERTISGMIADNEQEKQRHEQERADLIRERDEQIAHLNSMEVSFNDLHTKYERAKQLIITFKANEEALRTTLEKYQENQRKLENNYETLKQQAISKLNNANMEFDKIKRSHEAEVVKLTAQLKRKELYASSLEESVAQKNKENEDLTAICDELISKVTG